VAKAAADGRLLLLRYLTAEYPFDPSDVTLSYAQSFSVVSFIVEQWGKESIGELVNEFAKGVTHDEAFTAALGVNVDELEKMWRESLGSPSAVGSVGADGTSTEDFIINASAILLAGAAISSGAIAIRRYRKQMSLGEETEIDLFQMSNITNHAGGGHGD